MRFVYILLSFFLVTTVHASEQSASSAQPAEKLTFQEPFSSEALLQLVVGLVVVVGMILALSWAFRRFSGYAPMAKHMRVIGALPLSNREKLVLVQIGGKQILLGVAPGSVNRIETFEQPVISEQEVKGAFAAKLTEAVKARGGND